MLRFVLPVYQHHSAAVTGTQACRSTSRTNSAVDQTLRVVRVRLLSSQSSNSGSSSDRIETGPCNTWNIDRTSTNCQSLNQNTPYTLCFLRHGQSTWNRDNRFIGWTDTPLTDDGVLEARVAGQMLAKSGILFDEVHTSLLRRSIRTTNIVLMEMQQEYIPVHKHWRLNERNYGDLVGLNKKETVEKHGKEQVRKWRRSYDEPPPPMNPKHPYHPNRDPRYKNILDQIPATESLKCTVNRSQVYWKEVIEPSLRQGNTVLITGHENNLRALLMKLEDIREEDIINLCLPRAVPLAYRLDPVTLKPLDRLDGKRDEATGFLRGEWLGGDSAVASILERDRKQVYDTTVKDNLEVGPARENWKTWMEFIIGKPTPEQAAKVAVTASVPCVVPHTDVDDDDNKNNAVSMSSSVESSPSSGTTLNTIGGVSNSPASNAKLRSKTIPSFESQTTSTTIRLHTTDTRLDNTLNDTPMTKSISSNASNL